jgi:hypothetical protein
MAPPARGVCPFTVHYNAGEIAADSAPTVVGKVITGLTPHTLYSYRAEALNVIGAGVGEERTFTTLNRPPDAQAKDLHLLTQVPVDIDLLGLASDLDGDAMTITAVTQGQHGTVTTDGTKISYAPAPDYSGNDSFAYTVSDGFGGEDSAIITLHNALPLAAAIARRALANRSLLIRAQTTVTVTAMRWTVSAVTQGTSGTVTFSGTSITYTPGPQFSGRDSFSYTVTDGSASASATVVIRSTAAIAVVGPLTGGRCRDNQREPFTERSACQRMVFSPGRCKAPAVRRNGRSSRRPVR